MSSVIVSCTTFSTPYKGNKPPFFVTPETTPQEFQHTRELLLPYQLNDGDIHGAHALSQAASVGNLIMIQSIFEEGGPAFLSLGDKFGSTPLHYAVQHFQEKAVTLLIDLGSPINMTTTESFHVPGLEYLVTTGATPLDTAIRTSKLAISKILIKYGGLLNQPLLLEYQKNFLTLAQNEIAGERAPLVQAIDDSTGNNTFPLELRVMIADYAL